jgi:ubiquinone/menaquinone biosynthesis C-methylase UbiE
MTHYSMQENSPVILKDSVKKHWEDETCGTRFAEGVERREFFESISRNRYTVEPFIKSFAGFENYKGQEVLEIGVGAGADFENWVQNGAIATGFDLTEAAIELTRERLSLKGLSDGAFTLKTADAESLDIDNETFDLVYSYGVIHHSPDTAKCLDEIFRVLKPGGQTKLMVYATFSMTGVLLWIRHALLTGRPFQSQRAVIYKHLESPGTKTYAPAEFKRILEKHGFEVTSVRKQLGVGDLLNMPLSQKYDHPLYRLFYKIYPRPLIKLFGSGLGLFLLCEARKPG